MFKDVKRCLAVLNRARSIATNRVQRQNAPVAAVAAPSVYPSDKFLPGSNYEGFVCESAEYIPDFNMTAYQFKHQRLNSKYLHMDRNDQNNVFSINFRTTPFDSTGIPHILEHSVLCGSEKFPVRDPFFKMINRSMATFMNAMTGPDYTLYPFSSMNETDYRQLQTVYLDAVFKPNLNYLDFLQEGWRLENSDPKNIKSDHVIKGVVYNEMKGSFSENSNLLSSKFLNKILPGHTYGHCSGGEPLAIPDLSHEELVAFHRKYYHPSNARFFSYGNFPLKTTLRYINDQYLKKYEQIETNFSKVPLQKRWTSPKTEQIVCRLDNMGAPAERQHQIAIGYLLSDITDIYETLLLNVLTVLLWKGPNSPFYQSLIEPNISGGYSQMTGFESSIRDTMFVVGLQDVKIEDFEKIEQLVEETISKVVSEGFEADYVISVLNNIELGLKHQSPKFGLGLLFNLTPIWNHDGDVVHSVRYSELIAKLRNNLKNPKYLQEKVKKYFQEGNHKLVMTMSPDPNYEKKFNDSEQALIKQKSNSLSAADREVVFKNAKALEEYQKSPQDLNLLPCLSLSDVKEPPDSSYHLEETIVNNIPTQLVTVDTNNVSYIHGIFDASKLVNDQKLLLPLLANIIDQMGTKRQDYRSFDKTATANTSGIQFGLHFANSVTDPNLYNVGLGFSSYCLEQNISKMFAILQELLQSFNFTDSQRFEMLLQNYSSALSVGIANSGHLYAMQSAAGLVNESARLKAQLGAIEHIEYIRRLMETTKPSDILQQLEALAKELFNESSLKCALNTSKPIRDKYLAEYTSFVQNIAGNVEQSRSFSWLPSKEFESSNLHNVMTIPVNYCAKAMQTVPFCHPDFAALRVLGKALSSKYLLPVVREQNGAYGAGARIAKDGLFSFFSYRDPNTRKTLDTFDSSANWVRENWAKLDEQLLFEAKLGVLQQVDEPIAPGANGLEYFKHAIDERMHNEQRNLVLNVSRDDLDRVSDKYLKDGAVKAVGRFVLGPENEALGGTDGQKWTVKQM